MSNWDDEETTRKGSQVSMYEMKVDGSSWLEPHLFESSARPARALYQAKNAAKIPNTPPALMIGGFGAPAASRWRYPIPSRRKAKSRVKKREKNATVERRVQRTRMVVKMNQPCD